MLPSRKIWFYKFKIRKRTSPRLLWRITSCHNKKIRQTKKSFQPSDFQKSQRDFAFVIDKIFKIGLLEKIIKEIDESLIQEVKTVDVYEGENIPKDKKSVAINVTLQSPNKTLSEKDIDQISKKIIDVVKEKTGATIRS